MDSLPKGKDIFNIFVEIENGPIFMAINLLQAKNRYKQLWGMSMFFICGVLSISCTINIIFNFLYFKLNTSFCYGNLYFWHCQFLLFILSTAIILNKYQTTRARLFEVVFLCCCLCINIIFCLYEIIFIFYGIIVCVLLLTLLTGFYLILFYATTSVRLVLLCILNTLTLVLCQNIFKMHDIPESFKYKNVPTHVKKFFIKKIYY